MQFELIYDLRVDEATKRESVKASSAVIDLRHLETVACT